MATSGTSIQINKQIAASNPAQIAFNKLVVQLESARLKYEKTKESLDKKRAYTEQYLRPVLERTVQSEMKWMQIYFEECKMTKAKKRKELFARFILEEIDAMFMLSMVLSGEDEARLREIAKVCEDIAYSVDPDDKEDVRMLEKLFFENMMSNLQEQLKAEGLEVDFSGLSSDLSPEEVQMRVAEKLAQAKAQAKAEPQTKKKKLSKKELLREQQLAQKEEARRRSIGYIYKGLAKVLHPDLEKDPDERLRKEEIMKKLTIAYKENDLYSLLLLEKEWMNSSEDRLNAMDEDHLKIYLEVFKDQIRELQRNEAALVYHRDYTFICSLADGPNRLKYWKPDEARKMLEARGRFLEEGLRDMEHSKELRKAIIKGVLEKFKEKEEEEEDFLDFF
jgi:hypothetical protein